MPYLPTMKYLSYQLTNHLGSASVELNENAEIISYEEYHPFGTTSYRSGRSEVEVSLKRYKYVFKELDNETGLYYYGMRYYAPWIARFISVDPLQFEYPELTPFQYASYRPISGTDLDGGEFKDIANTAFVLLKKSQKQYYDSLHVNLDNKVYKTGANISKGNMYNYFSKTEIGRKFTNRFKKGGDFSEHSLVIRHRVEEKHKYIDKKIGWQYTGDSWGGGWAGVTRVSLISKNENGENVPISFGNIEAKDVKNSNLKFQFLIIIDSGGSSGALTIGHEIFLHALKYVDGAKKILDRYKNKELSNLDYNTIAKKLNDISKNRGKWGDNDHFEFAQNLFESRHFYEFFKQLKEVIPQKDIKNIEDEFQQEKKQYSKIKSKTFR